MKLPLILAAALALAGCAQLTGDPVADCLTARNMANNAQSAATLSQAIAASNPQSERMQQAAALAQASLTLALNQVAQLCPAPSN